MLYQPLGCRFQRGGGHPWLPVNAASCRVISWVSAPHWRLEATFTGTLEAYLHTKPG